MEPYTVEVTFDESKCNQLKDLRKLIDDLSRVENGNHGLANLVSMVERAKAICKVEQDYGEGLLAGMYVAIAIQSKQRAANGTSSGT
jgi:hypothetical protein